MLTQKDTLYRVAIDDSLDLDMRYAAARKMQEIRRQRLQKQPVISPDILRILYQVRILKVRKHGTRSDT